MKSLSSSMLIWLGVEVEEVYKLPYVIEQEWVKSMKSLSSSMLIW